MHPLLGDRRRFWAYLAVWAVLAAGLAAQLHLVGGLSWSRGLVVAYPASFAYAFICQASWYPVRSLRLGRTGLRRLVLTHLSGAVIATVVWLLAIRVWFEVLDRSQVPAGTPEAFGRQVPILAGFGMLLYLLAVSFHHLLLTFEESREAERRALELSVLAREAELKVLRTQIDPHFLFNALNSIAALTRSEPDTARAMSIRLAEFLRTSMRHGQRKLILLSEELHLARDFLAIERIRFGERLKIEERLGDGALECLVPPLILQPLVENAAHHGIARMLEGGTIRLTAERHGEALRIVVENQVDADAAGRRGAGTGLANVRERLLRSFGGEAEIETREAAGWFTARITLPAQLPESGAADERGRSEGRQ